MFVFKSRINLEKNSGMFKKFLKILSLRAFAEENPEPTSNTPEGIPKSKDGNEGVPAFNFEQLIAQARKEEKEKLYPEINRLREELKVMTANNNNNLLEVAKLKEELEKIKANNNESVEVAKLKEELEKIRNEYEDFKKNTVSEEDLRATLEKEYEVKTYLTEQKAANKNLILPMFFDSVAGETKEDIDNSIKNAIEMTNKAKEQLNVTTNIIQGSNTPVPPVVNPNGGIHKDSLDVGFLANLDLKTPEGKREYEEWRKKQGLK